MSVLVAHRGQNYLRTKNALIFQVRLIEMLVRTPAKEFPKVNALTTEQFIVKLCEIKRKSVQSS